MKLLIKTFTGSVFIVLSFLKNLCLKRIEDQEPVIFSRKAAKFAKAKMMKNGSIKSLRLYDFARGSFDPRRAAISASSIPV
jgi:hypothetical protein